MSFTLKILLVVTSLALTACGAVPAPLRCASPTRQVGMWYSTWYNGTSAKFYNDHIPSLGRYDSSDTAVMDTHVDMLTEAGVDFLVLDNTNNLYVDGGYILRNSQTLCTRLKTLKFAIAIGGLQFSGRTSTFDFEVAEIKRLFIDGTCKDAYLRTDDIPTIYSYAPDSFSDEQLSALAARHPDVNIDWIHGVARKGEGGWATPQPLPDCNTMAVMPGWNNHKGQSTERENHAFYAYVLDLTLAVKPKRVVIASFNDFAEDTFVEPTKEYGTSYWNQTVSFIKAYTQ